MAIVLAIILAFGARAVQGDTPTYTSRYVTATSDGTIQLNDTANTGVSVVIHAAPLSAAWISFEVLSNPPFGMPPLQATTRIDYYDVEVHSNGNPHGVPSVLCVTNANVTAATRMYYVQGLAWNASQNYWIGLDSAVSGHTICASMDESQLAPAGIGVGTARLSPPPARLDITETLELSAFFAIIILGVVYFSLRIDRKKYRSEPFTVSQK